MSLSQPSIGDAMQLTILERISGCTTVTRPGISPHIW